MTAVLILVQSVLAEACSLAPATVVGYMMCRSWRKLHAAPGAGDFGSDAAAPPIALAERSPEESA